MADWIFAFFHLGLILGVIGYAVGNYLGLGLAWLLQP